MKYRAIVELTHRSAPKDPIRVVVTGSTAAHVAHVANTIRRTEWGAQTVDEILDEAADDGFNFELHMLREISDPVRGRDSILAFFRDFFHLPRRSR
jgi:hypothetical protein